MTAAIHGQTANFDFKSELLSIMPGLRAFARKLCQRQDYAEDLVQEALLKAWSARGRFAPGTNLKSWVFVILRNAYLSEMRRNRFRAPYDPDVAEKLLSHPPEQEEGLHLGDLKAAIDQLPEERRQALLLVGAGGFSHEEAAKIADCPTGTIKSRVARARMAVQDLMNDRSSRPGNEPTSAATHDEILEELEAAARG